MLGHGVIRSVGSETNGTWKIAHRSFDSYGLQNKFPRQDDDTTPDFLGDADELVPAEAALRAAPVFFAGGEWDADAQVYVMGGRFYEPYSGRWMTDLGGENGYKFGDNNPTRERVIGETGLTDADYTSIYGSGLWGGFKYYAGEGFRATLGDEYLAQASMLELGVVLTVGVTAGVAAGVGATVAAGALGFGALGTAVFVGGVSGGAEYLGTTLTASAFNNFNDYGGSPGPTLEGFTSSVAFGAVTGGVLHGAGRAIGAGTRAASQSAKSLLARGSGDLVEDVARQRLARANAQLNILDNGICFVAGTPVLTSEQLEVIEEVVPAGNSNADSTLDELFLPAAAIAIGAAGYWVGERRSARRKREEEQIAAAAQARAFADWDRWDDTF